jgi:tRNA pseudouridine13 synthase
MIVKRLPEDFQVEEVPLVTPGPEGAFAYYRLEKSGWTTPDALAMVRRRWKLGPRRVSFGGLKDRHAVTVQYITILHGPRRGLNQEGVHVEYLGQLAAPYTSRDFDRNRFRLTVRDLAPESTATSTAALARLAVEGVPNYFDDQRFGSVSGDDGEFIGRLLVRGRFEDALRLALTAPYEFDRAAHKEEKRVLLAHWNDWETCRGKVRSSSTRRIIHHLCGHDDDFRGALLRLAPELRTLHLSAYQSHLWNRILAAWLRAHCPPEALRSVALRLGPAPFHVGLDTSRLAELSALSLPLPSARLRLGADDPQLAIINEVLAKEGLALRDLQVRGVREMFFSRGDRPALCIPRDLSHTFAVDELHQRRNKLLLAFELPRGSYATLLVKPLHAV